MQQPSFMQPTPEGSRNPTKSWPTTAASICKLNKSGSQSIVNRLKGLKMPCKIVYFRIFWFHSKFGFSIEDTYKDAVVQEGKASGNQEDLHVSTVLDRWNHSSESFPVALVIKHYPNDIWQMSWNCKHVAIYACSLGGFLDYGYCVLCIVWEHGCTRPVCTICNLCESMPM